MKHFLIFVFVALQILLGILLDKFDKLNTFVILIILCMMIGRLINFSKTNTQERLLYNIGYGLFYGSIISLAIVISIWLWLLFNFDGK